MVVMGALPPYDAAYSQPEEEKNFWGTDYVPQVRGEHGLRVSRGGRR